MSKIRTTLNWSDRLALIDHYTPCDEQICHAFGVTQHELDAARQMQTIGTLAPSTNIDFKSYSTLFVGKAATTLIKPSDVREVSTSTVKVQIKDPETATKKPLPKQKRGRKGNRIENAFAAIPATPMSVMAFIEQHAVSLAVLRQSKRFDKHPELGNVKVKKDKDTGELMVWREIANDQ